MSRPRVRLIIIVGVLALVVLSAASWFLLVSPRMSEAADISAEVDQVSLANSTLQARYRNVVKAATDAPAAAAAAQAEFAKMPETAELPQVITQLTDAARSAGIKPTDIATITTSVPTPVLPAGARAGAQGTPPPNASGINLAKMEVSMDVSGTPAQILQFTTNLLSLDRAILLTATDLTWKRFPDQPVTVDARVTGSMFVLQSALPDLANEVQNLLNKAGAATTGGAAQTVTQ